MDSRVMLFTICAIAAMVATSRASESQEAVHLEGKAKEQTWSSLDDKEIEDDGDVVTSLDEDKRAAHIFRYGRAPVFRYGKRAPSVFRYGKKATVFRYGKRSPAVDDLALVVPVDEATLDRLAASDYLPVAEEHKRKIFRYGKRSA